MLEASVPYPAHVVGKSQSPNCTTWILGHVVVCGSAHCSPWYTGMLQWKIGIKVSAPSSKLELRLQTLLIVALNGLPPFAGILNLHGSIHI